MPISPIPITDLRDVTRGEDAGIPPLVPATYIEVPDSPDFASAPSAKDHMVYVRSLDAGSATLTVVTSKVSSQGFTPTSYSITVADTEKFYLGPFQAEIFGASSTSFKTYFLASVASRIEIGCVRFGDTRVGKTTAPARQDDGSPVQLSVIDRRNRFAGREGSVTIADVENFAPSPTASSGVNSQWFSNNGQVLLDVEGTSAGVECKIYQRAGSHGLSPSADTTITTPDGERYLYGPFPVHRFGQQLSTIASAGTYNIAPVRVG